MRRIVRVTNWFFEDLDRLLGPERGPNGEPSRRDFDVYELLPIVDHVAEHFDHAMSEFDDRPDYRTIVVRGVLVWAIGVLAQRMPDGGVDLLGVTIDVHGPAGDPEAD